MNLNTVLSLIVTALIVVGGYAFTHGGIQGPAGMPGAQGQTGLNGSDGSNGANGRNGADGGPSYGAVSGTDHSNPESFLGAVTLGGNVVATSSIGTVTYTAAQFQNTSLLQHTAASAVTATLPASSTLSNFAPRAGDVRTVFLAAITSNVTLAGGTGTDLDTASSTKVCIAGAICRMDFVRKSNRDFEVFFNTGL